MSKQTVEVIGIRIAYEDQGRGEALVLLHGLCGSSRYWNQVIPELSSKYRVITPDLRGHGQSGVSDEAYPMDLMANDISELLEKLKIKQAILFGHSLGGYVTLAFAEKYADKLKGFALIHSSGFPDNEAGVAKRQLAIEGIRDHGIEPFIVGLTPKLFAPAHLEAMEETIAQIKQIGMETNPKGAMNVLTGMMARSDLNHIIADAQVPVLLVAGEADQIIPLDLAFAVEKPHITQVLLEQCGHLSMQEKPAELTAQMLAFAHHVYTR